MKRPLWTALSALSAMGTAMAMRQILGRVWPTDNEPPLNPADRDIPWGEALLWASAAGIGAGLARTIARRGAASAWSYAFDEDPPGLRS